MSILKLIWKVLLVEKPSPETKEWVVTALFSTIKVAVQRNSIWNAVTWFEGECDLLVLGITHQGSVFFFYNGFPNDGFLTVNAAEQLL